MTIVNAKHEPVLLSTRERWQFTFEDVDYEIFAYATYSNGEIADYQVGEIMHRTPENDGMLSTLPELSSSDRAHRERVRNAFIDGLHR